MRRIRLTMAALAIAFSAGVSLAGDVVTVSRNCTWCHGALGRGYSTAPRLAGQRHLYIMNQLYDFRSHARDNPFSQQYMWGATANLGLETARELADYFSSIPPTPANDGDRALAEIGRAIYLEGIPEYDIASCAACHGPNARGHRTDPASGRALVFVPRRGGSRSGARDTMWPPDHRCRASRADWLPTRSQRSRPTSASSRRGRS